MVVETGTRRREQGANSHVNHDGSTNVPRNLETLTPGQDQLYPEQRQFRRSCSNAALVRDGGPDPQQYARAKRKDGGLDCESRIKRRTWSRASCSKCQEVKVGQGKELDKRRRGFQIRFPVASGLRNRRELTHDLTNLHKH